MAKLMPDCTGPWLLLGGRGQIGSALFQLLKMAGYQVVAPSRSDLDLNNLNSVSLYLDALKPCGIINAAAYTNVDRAESAPVLVWRVNVELPRLLAQYSSQHQIRLLHFSSEYVYGDNGNSLLSESHPLSPQGVYAQSKAEADEAVLAIYPAALILRTSWVYAARGQNFMLTILALMQQKAHLQVVADQIGAPTPAALVAAVSMQVLSQPVCGVLNVASHGVCSWYEFALAILALAKQHELKGICCQHIEAIPSSAWLSVTRRPLNSRLDLALIEQHLGQRLPDWQQGLQSVFEEWLMLHSNTSVAATAKKS